jgi:hypothetical protein
MAKLTIKSLADMINEKCNEFGYFEAYGLVKESINLWKNEDNLSLLCETGRIMVSDVLEG